MNPFPSQITEEDMRRILRNTEWCKLSFKTKLKLCSDLRKRVSAKLTRMLTEDRGKQQYTVYGYFRSKNISLIKKLFERKCLTIFDIQKILEENPEIQVYFGQTGSQENPAYIPGNSGIGITRLSTSMKANNCFSRKQRKNQ